MGSDKRKCDGCAFASWDLTHNGRLHPSKGGRCLWESPVVALPNSRYYLNPPHLCGGRIKRGQFFAQECAQYKESSDA